MNLIIQALIIFGISYSGDFITATFNLPIPGSIIGITILFFGLYFKIIKLQYVETVGNWLKDHMALLFIPITVGLMQEYDLIAPHLVQLTIVMMVSTAFTYICVAKAVERFNNDK